MSEKKVSSYARGNSFDLPKWALADKKHAYRWTKVEGNSDRSDGYDYRGWEKARIPDGQTNSGDYLRYKEMILSKMPAEENERIKQEKHEAARMQVEAVIGKHAEEADKLNHELKAIGGRAKFSVEVK